MTHTELQDRARVFWRETMGMDTDDAFEKTWTEEILPSLKQLSPAEERVAETLAKRSIMAKLPIVTADRELVDFLHRAKAAFLAAGGTEAEWTGELPAVRKTYLREKALGVESWRRVQFTKKPAGW